MIRRLAFLCALLLTGSAMAAEMSVVPMDGGGAVIAIEGRIDPGDGKQFAAIASRYSRAVVAFNSPGGAVVAGLQIGQIIRLRHYPTLAPEGFMCASACALAWLAGTPRVIQVGGRVGFHAAFIEHDDGGKEESGVANALIGAYLTNLGLSMDAIVFVEQAHPDDITWLTAADVRGSAISFQVLPASTRRSEPERPAPASPAPAAPAPRPALRPFTVLTPELATPTDPDAGRAGRPLEDRARLFVRDYFAHWSEDNGEALAYFGASYAQSVVAYGRPVDRDALLRGKRDFAERWPVRVYSVRPADVHTFCNERNQTCTVTGVVDWDCRSVQRHAHSVGTANFTLTAVMTGEHGQVVAENGSVISRQTD